MRRYSHGRSYADGDCWTWLFALCRAAQWWASQPSIGPNLGHPRVNCWNKGIWYKDGPLKRKHLRERIIIADDLYLAMGFLVNDCIPALRASSPDLYVVDSWSVED